MNYTELHSTLSKRFNLSDSLIDFPDGNGDIVMQDFHSDKEENTEGSYSKAMQEAFMGYNSLSYRNLHFRYPVFYPKGERSRKGAILLLHGLNERSWEKYLSWAYQLAMETGKAIILFPISLHMNRSPEAWGDPRQMNHFVKSRQLFIPEVKDLSVANVALSERLTNEPEQFFLSGYQSAQDIIQLSSSISAGKNPLFDKGASIDFFGYSIGAFLSEILLIANPENIFNHSKFFFFCGGSAFSELKGTSKYILDNKAFERLLEFYIKELDKEILRKGSFSYLIRNTPLGKAFRHMINLKQYKKVPKNLRKKIAEQISVVALKRDSIVPLAGLKKTLKNIKLSVLDFNFNYSHEVPFPIYSDNKKQEVDLAFKKVFQIAGSALA